MLGNKYTRGLLASCCPVREMIKLCEILNIDGVIQTDVTDAYYFNENEEYTIEALKRNSRVRSFINTLVINSIRNRCAYPKINNNSDVVNN